MSGFGVLLGKELMEQWRTFKFLIIGGVFLFFGLSTPLLIKYLPELIELAGTGGMSIEIPPPTAIQAMAEYSATMAQFGVLIAVLVAMGAVAKEVESGTAMMVLSKPVSRTAYILAKFSAGSLNFVAALLVGGLACWVYTLILFGEAPVIGFVGQNVLLGLFLMLGLAVTLFFSSLFRNQLAAGGLALAAIIAQTALSALPWVGKYLPGQLINWGNNLLAGVSGAAWGALAVTLGVIGLALYFARYILNRKEL
jgi:ABC-2 type transport system permease protein